MSSEGAIPKTFVCALTNSTMLGKAAEIEYPVGARMPSGLLPIAFANSGFVGAVEKAASVG